MPLAVIEALNFAVNIGALVSWPPLAMVAIVYYIYRSSDREIGRPLSRFLSVGLFIGTLGYALDLADRFGGIQRLKDAVPLEAVYDQHFTDERVILDGRSFHHCVFSNVTLVTNGGRTKLNNNQFNGSLMVSTDNASITNAIGILNGMGFLKVTVSDRGGKVFPPYGESPSFGPVPTQR